MSNAKIGKSPHNKGKKSEIKHGTISGYNRYKCRCAECKKANSEYVKRRRKILTPTAVKQLGL